MNVYPVLVTMEATARIKSTDSHVSVWMAGLAIVIARTGIHCVLRGTVTTMVIATI